MQTGADFLSPAKYDYKINLFTYNSTSMKSELLNNLHLYQRRPEFLQEGSVVESEGSNFRVSFGQSQDYHHKTRDDVIQSNKGRLKITCNCGNEKEASKKIIRSLMTKVKKLSLELKTKNEQFEVQNGLLKVYQTQSEVISKRNSKLKNE